MSTFGCDKCFGDGWCYGGRIGKDDKEKYRCTCGRPLPSSHRLDAPLKDEELEMIEVAWRSMPEGPWETVQLPGFGAQEFLIRNSPEGLKDGHAMAMFLNLGSHIDRKNLARAREDVPRLCTEIRRLKEEIRKFERLRDETPW